MPEARTIARTLALALGAWAAAGPVLAQSADGTGRKVATALRIARGSSPRIDGRLDDALWSRATFFTDFVAKQPVEGAEPGVRTRVALAYDDEALYVGARMDGGRPNDVPVLVTRRDNFSA